MTTSPAISGGAAEAEALFRTKRVPEIRAAESATRREISAKEEELRQLVGRSYRDLLDSADSILLIKQTSDSISSNLSLISTSLSSLHSSSSSSSSSSQKSQSLVTSRAPIYSVAARAKYLVDTPEQIWGCLDESLLVESAGRYLRARIVHRLLDASAFSKFVVLRHQSQIIDGFKPQISQRSRDRLGDRGLPVSAYADALAAAASIDNLTPYQSLQLFLDSRRSWISQRIGATSTESSDIRSCSLVLCDVVRTVRDSLGQVGELFVHAVNEMPLFYKTVLGSPPGAQLFGGIPNPEEEVRIWKEHREQLESRMVLLEPEVIANVCSTWLKGCCDEIFGDVMGNRRLVDAIGTGEGLASTEKLVREVLDGRDGLEESLEQWLRNVFGSEIESPWDQIRGLILKDGKDTLENRLEEAFVTRMKEIVRSEFDCLGGDVKVMELIEGIKVSGGSKDDGSDFQQYLKKASTGGRVWFSEAKQKRGGILAHLKPIADENDFQSCLSSYFGSEVSQIRDVVDSKCKSILEDVLSFVESHNSSTRLKGLVPYLQEKCYKTISGLLKDLECELGKLSASLGSQKEDKLSTAGSVIVERSLFVGRLLFALRYHSSHVPLILGSPRQWVKEAGGAAFSRLSSPLPRYSMATFDIPVSFTPRRHTFDSLKSPGKQFADSPRRQNISAAAALFGADDSSNPRLDELNKTMQALCIRAHSLWITWVSAELSQVLSRDLNKDDTLASATPLRGWEVTVIKQEESAEGPLEMQIALPSMPSLYIVSFLYQACLEIHKVGGHILDRIILQNFAWELLQKVLHIYENFLVLMEDGTSRVSEKGILQVLLDMRFIGDILSGGKNPATNGSFDTKTTQDLTQSLVQKTALRRKQSLIQTDPATLEPVTKLINKLSQRLDPIDWATYEPYLWENEKQSYKRYAVLFGFLVQLNRMYTDTAQKLPTKSNTDSNIMRCSQVPRFKYLPISAPALSSRGSHKSAVQTSSDDSSSRSPWKSFSNGERSMAPEFDDNMSFGVGAGTAPLLKSFVTQVGSKFGESTSRWGSMLSDGQVGKLKDRSAAAMSTFSDILPGPAAGLFSSLTAGGRFDS